MHHQFEGQSTWNFHVLGIGGSAYSDRRCEVLCPMQVEISDVLLLWESLNMVGGILSVVLGTMNMLFVSHTGSGRYYQLIATIRVSCPGLF